MTSLAGDDRSFIVVFRPPRMTGYARSVKNGSAMCGIAQMGPQLKKSAQQFFLGQYLSFLGGDS